MQYEKSCGAVVFRRYHGNLELLLIRHANGGHWSFPKGHIEEGETEVQTALREVKEETGIDILLDESFRESVSYWPKKDTKKEVVYFVGKAKHYDAIPQPQEIAQIKWVELSRAEHLLTYENDRRLIAKVRTLLKLCY